MVFVLEELLVMHLTTCYEHLTVDAEPTFRATIPLLICGHLTEVKPIGVLPTDSPS